MNILLCNWNGYHSPPSRSHLPHQSHKYTMDLQIYKYLICTNLSNNWQWCHLNCSICDVIGLIVGLKKMTHWIHSHRSLLLIDNERVCLFHPIQCKYVKLIETSAFCIRIWKKERKNPISMTFRLKWDRMVDHTRCFMLCISYFTVWCLLGGRQMSQFAFWLMFTTIPSPRSVATDSFSFQDKILEK